MARPLSRRGPLGLVSHPNVCRVYDIGEIDGHPFLSMEYIDGEDLASLLRRNCRLPQDKALDVARAGGPASLAAAAATNGSACRRSQLIRRTLDAQAQLDSARAFARVALLMKKSGRY